MKVEVFCLIKLGKSANRQSVYTVMNGHFYHLDGDGVLQDAVALDAIGLKQAPCDLQALADGRVLVGNRETRVIVACDGHLSVCERFYALPSLDGRESVGRIAEEASFDFYFEAATGRLFTVDTILREFAIVDPSDRTRSLVLDQEDLSLPSDIRVDRNKSQAAGYRQLSWLAFVCLVMFVLFCLFLVWRVYRMRRPETAPIEAS